MLYTYLINCWAFRMFPNFYIMNDATITLFVFMCQFKYFFGLFFFFRATPMAYGGSRLGVESELQLPAYTTATAMGDPSHVFDLYHSLWQCQILNPLSEARNQTCILLDTSQICFHWAMMGTPCLSLILKNILHNWNFWSRWFL